MAISLSSEVEARDILRLPEFPNPETKEGDGVTDNSFARKSVHWTKDDVRAAGAVLREDCWDLSHSLNRIDHEQEMEGSPVREGYVIEACTRPIAKLIFILGKDYSAVRSLLIFVYEFRDLIEEAQQQEGSENAGAQPQGERRKK